MFDIHKILSLLLTINLPQIFTIYDIQGLRQLLEDLRQNILGGATLVYNRYSEQLVCNLTKRRTLPPVFSGKNFRKAVDNCFRTIPAEDLQENILGRAILVYNRYSEQSVCKMTKRRALPPVFSGEIFENGWLLLNSPSCL